MSLTTFLHSIKNAAIEKGWLRAVYNHTCKIYSISASEELFAAQKCGLQNPFMNPGNITQHTTPYLDTLSYYLGVDYVDAIQNVASTLNVTAENCADYFADNVLYATAGVADCIRSEEIATYIPTYQALVVGISVATVSVASLATLYLCNNTPKKR